MAEEAVEDLLERRFVEGDFDFAVEPVGDGNEPGVVDDDGNTDQFFEFAKHFA